MLFSGVLFLIEWASSRSAVRLPDYIGLLGIAWALSVIYWPNSDLPQRSIGYSLWFAFDVLGIFLFFNIFKTQEKFIFLIRLVLISVCINAFFGLSQFVLGVLGFNPPLVAQWWIEGVLPRVNGFNYEPSYFATYLALGWVLSLYLWEKKAPLLGHKLIIITAVSSSLAMLMCSSRMGWFAMILWLLRPLVQAMRDLFIKGRLAVRRMRLLACYLVVFGAAVGSVFTIFSLDQLSILLGGLGLVNSSDSFSADDRSSLTRATGFIALEHLFIGVGFGGVPAEIAKLSGATLMSLDDAKNYEGQNITFELVASLGLLGALSIYLYFFLTIRKALFLSKIIYSSASPIPPELKLLSICLRGLSWALVVEILLLQFNQNFLRTYTWAFAGVLIAAVRVASLVRNSNSSSDHKDNYSTHDVYS